MSGLRTVREVMSSEVSTLDVNDKLTIADDVRGRLRAVASGPVPRERAESLRTVADLLNFSKPEIDLSCNRSVRSTSPLKAKP